MRNSKWTKLAPTWSQNQVNITAVSEVKSRWRVTGTNCSHTDEKTVMLKDPGLCFILVLFWNHALVSLPVPHLSSSLLTRLTCPLPSSLTSPVLLPSSVCLYIMFVLLHVFVSLLCVVPGLSLLQFGCFRFWFDLNFTFSLHLVWAFWMLLCLLSLNPLFLYSFGFFIIKITFCSPLLARVCIWVLKYNIYRKKTRKREKTNTDRITHTHTHTHTHFSPLCVCVCVYIYIYIYIYIYK